MGNRRRTSKYLSYILRHNPDEIGLSLDPAGWARLDDLIGKSRDAGRSISRDDILEVITGGGKQRFTLSADGKYIRANYGHSIDVDLEYEPLAPPEHLFHGTAERNLDSIRRKGLRPGNRQYVHLSGTREDARSVGQRHGRPVVLEVYSLDMHRNGMRFYRSDAGIWLTKHVPPEYLRFPDH